MVVQCKYGHTVLGTDTLDKVSHPEFCLWLDLGYQNTLVKVRIRLWSCFIFSVSNYFFQPVPQSYPNLNQVL